MGRERSFASAGSSPRGSEEHPYYTPVYLVLPSVALQRPFGRQVLRRIGNLHAFGSEHFKVKFTRASLPTSDLR